MGRNRRGKNKKKGAAAAADGAPPPAAEGAAAGSASGSPGKKRPRDERYEGTNSSSGHTTKGPPVAQISGRMSGSVPNDEWQTTERTWASVAPFFTAWRAKRIWMPFYYDGKCADHLRRLGFANVVHDDVDFFTRATDKKFLKSIALIWDNPPYTSPDTKEKVLRALAATRKPFVMLLPMSILHVGFVREVVDMASVQAIVPRRVWVRKVDGDELPFKYLVWFCSGVKLKRDLLFLDDEETGGG